MAIKKKTRPRIDSPLTTKKKETYAATIRKATILDKDLINASPRVKRDPDSVSDERAEERAKKRAAKAEKRAAKQSRKTGETVKKVVFKIETLSRQQIEIATDRVIMGERVAKVADEFNVSSTALAEEIKKRCGALYMNAWQQSIQYDCLRAELLLKKGLQGALEGDNVAWAKIALSVLEYRAKVLGFGAVNPQEQTPRVAGMSRDDVFQKILAFV